MFLYQIAIKFQMLENSAKIYIFMLFIFLELILPVQEERPVSVILGVLLCFRHLVPHLSDAMSSQNFKGNVTIIQNEEDMWVTKEQLLKVCYSI